MSSHQATAASDSALPCPLPREDEDDADALREYRAARGDDRAFSRARRKLRETGDWRGMAKLLAEHAATGSGDPSKAAKVVELSIQAYELFAERVRDLPSAAYALARAVLAQPENERAYERLYVTYSELGWNVELAALLRWRMDWARRAQQPQLLGPLHLAYADLQRSTFHAIGEAVEHYYHALRVDPTLTEASEQLIELHLAAGAWDRTTKLMTDELAVLEGHPTYAKDPAVAKRIGELHLRLARIASEQQQDLAGAARHLQAAIKATPQSLAALRAFGNLYLGSGKA
ncbi:MAG: hypothetical protein KC457_18975, partial [Myxococcales bacterium]|nr:hypothetical protein [Myxococcales bacterium]